MTKCWKTLTPKRIFSLNPCTDWDMERIQAAFRQHGKRSVTIAEFAACRDIPVMDRIWVLCHKRVLPVRTLRLFACYCATSALLAERKAGREPDPRSCEAVRVARRFAYGKVTAKELAEACLAGEAAWLAAEPVAGEACRAAWAACRAAEADARWAAAGAWMGRQEETRAAQLQWLRRAVFQAHGEQR